MKITNAGVVTVVAIILGGGISLHAQTPVTGPESHLNDKEQSQQDINNAFENAEIDIKCAEGLSEMVSRSTVPPPNFKTSEGVYVDVTAILDQLAANVIFEEMAPITANPEAIRAVIPVLNSRVDRIAPNCVERTFGDQLRDSGVTLDKPKK